MNDTRSKPWPDLTFIVEPEHSSRCVEAIELWDDGDVDIHLVDDGTITLDKRDFAKIGDAWSELQEHLDEQKSSLQAILEAKRERAERKMAEEQGRKSEYEACGKMLAMGPCAQPKGHPHGYCNIEGLVPGFSNAKRVTCPCGQMRKGNCVICGDFDNEA